MSMEIIRNRENSFGYSLHDSRIKKVAFKDNNLIFNLDYVFRYDENGEEHGYEADIIFTSCDPEDGWVLIFDEILSEGKFSGKRMTIRDFMEVAENREFEIITEGYWGCFEIFTGWLWKKKKPVSAQFEIWHDGDMIYRIGKKVF